MINRDQMHTKCEKEEEEVRRRDDTNNEEEKCWHVLDRKKPLQQTF